MSVDAILSHVWTSELLKEFEKERANLIGAVTEEDNPGYLTVNKPVISPQDAYKNKPRGALVQFPEEESRLVTITHVSYTAPRLIDNFDAASSNFSYRQTLTSQIVAALNRGIDEEIAAALNESTNSISVALSMNLAGLQKHAKAHSLAFSMKKGQMYMVTTPDGMDDIRQDPNATNNYHYRNEIVRTNAIEMASGFAFIEEPVALPISGVGQRRRFSVNKQATCLRYSQRPKVEVAYSVERQSWIIVGSVFCGAKIVMPEGVRYSDITSD